MIDETMGFQLERLTPKTLNITVLSAETMTPLNFTWSVVSFKGDNLTLQLEFEKPV